jgi:hypothetical protein
VRKSVKDIGRERKKEMEREKKKTTTRRKKKIILPVMLKTKNDS